MTEYERDLWRRYRKGDEQAREELQSMHLPRVTLLVSDIHRIVSRVDLAVLMNAGVLGLWKAISKFDYNRGVKFETYARNFIRGEIFAEPEVHRNMPRRQFENFVKLMEAQKRLVERVDGKPTLAEIAEEAGLTLVQAQRALDARNIAFPTNSIDHQGDQVSDDDSDENSQRKAAAFEKPAPEPAATLEDRYGEQLDAAIRKLSKLEAEIVVACYWDNERDAEIAARYGFTVAKTRKIRQRALLKLRGMFVEGSNNE